MVGEHIRARRNGRWTHAIDCGDATVIHLVENGEVRVRRSYRPEFVAGADAVEVVTHRERTFAASEIVARAYSRIAASGLAAMFRDSEAFAEWCATGRLPAGKATVAAGPSGGASSTARKRPGTTAKVGRRAARAAAPARPRKKARAAASRQAAPRSSAKKQAAPARKKAARRPARSRSRGRRR